jgi:hypothetical protein
LEAEGRDQDRESSIATGEWKDSGELPAADVVEGLGDDLNKEFGGGGGCRWVEE